MDYEPDPEPPCRSCLGWKQRCDKLTAEVARLNLAAQRAASERETAGKWVAVVSDLRAEVKRLTDTLSKAADATSPVE